MSKRETPMTLRYWEKVGGTIVEEFSAIPRGQDHGARILDAVIIPDGPKMRAKKSEVEIEGKDIIVVQTKAKRLGMYLMGQVVFSAELMKRYNPRSIKSVALCKKGDSVLEPLLEAYENVEVVIDSA